MANLNGSWLGTYWQEGLATRFELTLVQEGNSLSGNILDNNYLGEATLAGEVIGKKITFTKRYLTGLRHSVYYNGTVADDENFMSGKWSVGRLAGTWEASRSDDNLTLNLEVRSTEKVPLSVT